MNMVSIFNKSITADTNILDSDFSHQYQCVLDIYCCFSGAGILSVKRTFGGTTITEKLNSNTQLIASAPYYFNITYDIGETINLQYSTSTTCLKLKIEKERFRR